MSKNAEVNSGGVGILGILGIVFVTLKLTGYINWSWWYVTLPFWGGLVLVVVFVILMLIAYLVKELWVTRKRSRN